MEKGNRSGKFLFFSVIAIAILFSVNLFSMGFSNIPFKDTSTKELTTQKHYPTVVKKDTDRPKINRATNKPPFGKEAGEKLKKLSTLTLLLLWHG